VCKKLSASIQAHRSTARGLSSVHAINYLILHERSENWQAQGMPCLQVAAEEAGAGDPHHQAWVGDQCLRAGALLAEALAEATESLPSRVHRLCLCQQRTSTLRRASRSLTRRQDSACLALAYRMPGSVLASLAPRTSLKADFAMLICCRSRRSASGSKDI